MNYIISDIHGCYEEYKELLEKIHFSNEDTLYVLGDSVDRGPEPIRVLQDMMNRSNVINILGNHDLVMLIVLKKLAVEIKEDNIEGYLTVDDLELYQGWMEDGGGVTCKQFRQLSLEERNDILEYIKDSSTYEVVQIHDKTFVMAHSGIDGYQEGKSLEEYNFTDFVTARTDYSKRCFADPNTYLVTGHTPTVYIREDKKPLVYEKNGHIAIDCGCVFGGRLAAYCLDTGEVYYVDSKISQG